MANVHEFRIEGTVPFNYLSEMPDEDAAFFARFVFSPTTGLVMHVDRRSEFYVPNEHGGRTATYRFRLVGEEAVSGPARERLVDALIAGGADMTARQARDVENAGVWFRIE